MVPLRCDLTHSAWYAGAVEVVKPLPILPRQFSCPEFVLQDVKKELTETSDRATDDELRKAVGRRLNDFANHPKGKTEDECASAPKQVTNEDCRDG